jgi:preprotein translocase subunit SecA
MVLRQHPYDVAVVDESDNLFIDTAGNSARIGSGSSSKLHWVYPLILKSVRNHESNESMTSA